MKFLKLTLVSALILLNLSLNTKASTLVVQPEKLVLCQYKAFTGPPNKNAAANCQATSVNDIDPQNREIWVFGNLVITSELLNTTAPLGMYISGKTSSRVYLNGIYLGENGTPGATKIAETPGVMDAVIYLPKEKLKLGVNEFALHMSSHHGLLALDHPIHFIGLAEYANPTYKALSGYWLSLLPFGALLIGALYMGMLALVKRDHWSVSLLPLMSLVGATQLYIEAYRGLVAYLYPMHDLRLALILACSLLFGLCLAAHVIWSIGVTRKITAFAFTVIITLLVVLLSGSFDAKSVFALFVPASTSLLLAVGRLQFKEPKTLVIVIGLGMFLLCLMLSPDEFLNVTFFYLLALLLIVLFINEILAYSKARKEQLEQQALTEKLRTIVEQQKGQASSETISVGSAGQLEVIEISKIIYCKGAGDYVELVLSDDRSLLHSERLNELEKNLPPMFLRVHRSYIVNSALISTLNRKQSGVGELAMAGGQTVPVSRRVMPSVRDALS